MRTNVRVGAIILRDNKLLLIHRRKNGSEYWVLVGGGVEEGETNEEALFREVAEETSLKVKEFKVELETDADIDTKNIFHIVYKCEIEEGEPKLGGPEQKANNPDNWYNPEWVGLNEVAMIEDIYPRVIREWAKKQISKTK